MTADPKNILPVRNQTGDLEKAIPSPTLQPPMISNKDERNTNKEVINHVFSMMEMFKKILNETNDATDKNILEQKKRVQHKI